jgi:tetratricopeptide (TPR) repeat protein
MSESMIWQTRPIFISSTFKDMGAERDYLRQHVFPELEERLRERRCHLEPVDLRWGVETISIDDEQSKEILVLKVCLGEIERSKPFLIALIGDRYGWIPPIDRMENAAMEAGFIGNLREKSITALELDYGVFNNPEQKIRSFFYLREPLPYNLMPPEIASDYSDRLSISSNTRIAAINLDLLKERLLKDKSLAGRVKSYNALWDNINNKVTGLEAFGKMVLEDLWNDLDKDTSEFIYQPAVEWEEQERRMLDDFIESRAKRFIGRSELINELTDFALNQEKDKKVSAVCLTGSAGSGKSALFAYLFRELWKRDIIVLANSAGSGFRSDNINDVLMRWIGELAAVQNISKPLPEKASTEDIDKVFQDLLCSSCLNKRVVILMDALNQMGKSIRINYMQWLPENLPANCRLIVTGIPCGATDSLIKKEWTLHLELHLLEKSEAEKIALSICRKYHRTLNKEILAEMLNKEKNDGLPAVSNPLWLTMAVEEINLIDMDDFSLAERKYTGTSEQKLHKLLLDTVLDMPPDVENLYQWIFTRIEKTYGRPLVENCLSLVAISRKGWRESDLQAVVPRITGSPWNELSFSGLKRTLRAHLIYLGNYRQLNFAHSQMRNAIMGFYFFDERKRKKLHTMIDLYLFSISFDPFASSERMYHLLCLNNIQDIAEYYGGLFSQNENNDSDQTLAEFIYNGPADELDRRIQFALDTMREPSLMITRKIRIIKKYLQDLPVAIGFHLDLKSKLKYFEAILKYLEELVQEDTGIVVWRYYISFCHKEIGDILFSTGDLKGSLNSFMKGQAISESLLLTDSENIGLKWGLSKSLLKIGHVLLMKRDTGGALKAQKASYEIAESLVISNPSDLLWQRHLVLVHINLGSALLVSGDQDGAEQSFRSGLGISESCSHMDPQNKDILHDLSQCHINLGALCLEKAELSEAMEHFNISSEYIESVAGKYPSDLNVQRDLSLCFEMIGDTLFKNEHWQEALDFFRKSREITESNVSSDPLNVIWMNDLAENLTKTGKVLEATGDKKGALLSYQESLEIRKRLYLNDPDNTGLQKDLAATYNRIGDIMLKMGELLNAQDAFIKNLKIIKLLAKTDPGSTDIQLELAMANYRVGFALSTTSVQEAKNYKSKCLDILHNLQEIGVYLDTSIISLIKDLESKIR